MKKILITAGLLMSLTTSIFAATASTNMVAIKDKSMPYPKNGKEIYTYFMNGMACAIDAGNQVKVLDSTWSMKKVMNLENGCVGWVPTEWIN